MRATLKQVADDAGLSIATVSRALRRKNRRYSVNEEKIYAAARKLGYPFIGESDSSDKTTIALVTEIQQGEFYSLLFHVSMFLIANCIYGKRPKNQVFCHYISCLWGYQIGYSGI